MEERTEGDKKREKPRSGGSLAVAAGIFGSRLAGLVRQSVFAYYFGNSAAADVFNAGFRIPNLLQNLFGEGALSASFIPVYARLKAEGREKEAASVAWTVASLLTLSVCLLVLLGVLATPLLIDLIAPGFRGEKREATIRLVQVFFPGAGLLVLSAWCLGVLNSHRRFLLPYLAPVVWSGAIVAALLFFGGREGGYRLAEWAAWGSVAGSALQFAVQLPLVVALIGRPGPALASSAAGVREVFANFVPVAISRGVVQISAYVDQIIASFLPTGAVAALSYAQVIYTLPISLFGMAVSAAELPEMSSLVGSGEEVAKALRERLTSGLTRIAYFVVPSVAALLFFGDMLAGLFFQRGRFGQEDAAYVWLILMGGAVGLLAATFGRLYSSAFYALKDTRTPLRYALVRVALTCALGYLFALPLPRLLGIDPALGAAGLTVSAGMAGWIEYALLRRGIEAKIGPAGVPKGGLKPLWVAALAAAVAGLGVKFLTLPLAGQPFVRSSLVVAVYCLAYLGITVRLGIGEGGALLARVRRLWP